MHGIVKAYIYTPINKADRKEFSMCFIVNGGFFAVCFIVQDFQEVATDFVFPVVLREW